MSIYILENAECNFQNVEFSWDLGIFVPYLTHGSYIGTPKKNR
jgi:hypothetical protein